MKNFFRKLLLLGLTFSFFSLVAGLIVLPAPRVLAAPPSGQTWTETWSDEFNGTALDTSKWSAVNNCGDKRNNEQECYMADDVSVSNGYLDIKSEKRSQSGFSYTSGAIKTGSKFTPAYGYVEFSAKMPAGGQGLWPALWLYPTNAWPPEIDVLEAVNDMNTIYMTYHWGSSSSPQQDGSAVGISGASSGFHTYAVDWEPGVIRWYIDGNLEKTYTGSDVTSMAMQLYINTALGGSWPGSVGSTTAFPQDMLVDYVRVYTEGGSPDTTAPTVSITSPTSGATVSGSSTTVSATASDNVGVSGVQFKLDGSNLGSEDTSSPYSISWDTTSTTNGSHTLTAVARDAAGNTKTSSSVSVTVNNQTVTPLLGDINLDHIVNSLDWSIMNSKWFTSDSSSDLNKDGLVNSLDFSILNSNWFKTW